MLVQFYKMTGIRFVVAQENIQEIEKIVTQLEVEYYDVTCQVYAPSLGNKLDGNIVFLEASEKLGEDLLEELVRRKVKTVVIDRSPTFEKTRYYFRMKKVDDYLGFADQITKYKSVINGLL